VWGFGLGNNKGGEMLFERTVLILLSIVPAGTLFAAALEVVDLHSAASSIAASNADSADLHRELIADPLVQTTADDDAMFQRVMNNASAAAHTGDLHTGVPWGFVPNRAAPGSAPAPASMWIVGIGLIGVAAIARRRSEMPGVAAVDA
jgi:PEP-CTERM motif